MTDKGTAIIIFSGNVHVSSRCFPSQNKTSAQRASQFASVLLDIMDLMIRLRNNVQYQIEAVRLHLTAHNVRSVMVSLNPNSNLPVQWDLPMIRMCTSERSRLCSSSQFPLAYRFSTIIHPSYCK